MINKKNIQLWVDALRSEEYKQTRGALARKKNGKTRYCCLGVACEVAIKHGVDVHVQPERGATVLQYDGEEGTLPDRVARWLGLEHVPSAIMRGGKRTSLTAMNDTTRSTFATIANAIERTYLN